jgi:hypothetical protein
MENRVLILVYASASAQFTNARMKHTEIRRFERISSLREQVVEPTGRAMTEEKPETPSVPAESSAQDRRRETLSILIDKLLKAYAF